MDTHIKVYLKVFYVLSFVLTLFVFVLYISTSSSAMTERPREESAILRDWVTLRLNFTLKSYISRQYYGPLDGGMVILQFAAGSFHTQRNFVADFIRLKLNFIQKSLFEPPFGGLRGNVRTPSTARWKARDRLPIRHELFSLSLTVETL